MIRTVYRKTGTWRLAVATAVVGLLVGSAVWAALEGTDVTERRIERIRTLTDQVLDQHGLDADEEAVVQRVKDGFFAAEPDCPATADLPPPVTAEECRRQARDLTDRVVQAEFGEFDRKEVEAEARETYPTFEVGDIVDVVFRLNPARSEKVRGVYSGRTPRFIQVGRWQIMVDDLVSVNGDDENPALKFDRERSRELREAYVNEKVTAFEAKRDRYRDMALVVARREKYRAGAETNEKRGYLFWEGEWLPAVEAIRSIVLDVWTQRLDERQRRRVASVNAIRADVASLVAAEMAAADLAPNSLNVDPQAQHDKLRSAVEEERTRREEKEKVRLKAGEEAAAASSEIDDEVVADDGTADAETAQDDDVDVDVGGGIPFGFLAILGVFALVTVAGIAFYMRQRAMREPTSFFKGKGRLQKNFWSMAEADPENFKYVSYLFPTMEDAQEALATLSFIHETPDGQLTCPHDILFGFYPHQGKFVSFVGGAELHYALWREASAVMPELPGAEYFKVSTAPEVLLEIPDIEALLHDEDLKITHVENREGEGDDYSQYYIYKAPDKENALEFLRRARVDEAGVHVLVETPQGVWGKDENGIYRE